MQHGRRCRRWPGPRPVRVGATGCGGSSSRTDLPLVVDADGLNLLAAEPRERGDWLLTPHPGEAARLLGGATVESVQRDRRRRGSRARGAVSRDRRIERTEHARRLAARRRAARASAIAAIPGMATGGTGDVLAGTLGALLVQTGDLEQAARAGVLLHALGRRRGGEGRRARHGRRRSVAASASMGESELIAELDSEPAFADARGGVRARRCAPRALGRSCSGCAAISAAARRPGSARCCAASGYGGRVPSPTYTLLEQYACDGLTRRPSRSLPAARRGGAREPRAARLARRAGALDRRRVARAGAAARRALRLDARVRRHGARRPARRRATAGTRLGIEALTFASSGGV